MPLCYSFWDEYDFKWTHICPACWDGTEPDAEVKNLAGDELECAKCQGVIK